MPKQTVKAHIPKAAPAKKPIWIFVLAFLLFIFIGGGLICFQVYRTIQTVEYYVVPAQSEPYQLKDGANIGTVVKDLAGNHYHKYILEIWVKINRLRYPIIQKGPYLVDGQKTIGQILDDMMKGNIVKIKLPTVALIEGMNYLTVQRRLQANADLVKDPKLEQIFEDASEFMKSVLLKNPEDESLMQAINGPHKSLEGLLMPATYEYEQGKTVNSQLLADALMKMALFMRDQYIERNQKIDRYITTPYEVLIMASLVERESSIESERPMIAGVFLNRLIKGIKLQTDPAVMYGVKPDFKGPLLLSQLKRDTPYNTYVHTGLPPTPICMPSESAIMAVLNPAETKALFFVAKSADPNDGHAFSETLKEHNIAVRAYRKAVREYKQKQEEAQKNLQVTEQTSNISIN